MAAHRKKKSPKKSAKRKPARMRAAAKPIELYYWPTPNGWKASIALEEMKLPYVMKPVNIGKGEQFTAAFLKISPNNRIPAIVDPDGPGGRPVSVFESGAILQYLGRKTGKLYPADARGRIQVEEWLYWQVGNLGPMVGQAFHFITYSKQDVTYAKNRYVDEVNRLFGVMNERLKARKYLAGAYSIADIACWGWVSAAMTIQPMDAFPHLQAWQERMAARPAVKRGKELGAELRRPLSDEEKKILFGQRAH